MGEDDQVRGFEQRMIGGERLRIGHVEGGASDASCAQGSAEGLLVHDREMTLTLESAYSRRVKLRVQKYDLRDNVFSRQVVLVAMF